MRILDLLEYVINVNVQLSWIQGPAYSHPQMGEQMGGFLCGIHVNDVSGVRQQARKKKTRRAQ